MSAKVYNFFEDLAVVVIFIGLLWIGSRAEVTVLFCIVTVIGIAATLWVCNYRAERVVGLISGHDTENLVELLGIKSKHRENEEKVYKKAVSTAKYYNDISLFAGGMIEIIYIAAFLAKFPDNWYKFVAYVVMITVLLGCSIIIFLKRQRKIRDIHKVLKG